MSQRGIGIVLEGLQRPVKESLRAASQLSFRHVELPVVRGEVSPAQLASSGRRHLAHYVRGLGLELSALGADLGGARFTDGAGVDHRLDQTRRIIEMAADVGVPVVTSHLGRVDERVLKAGYLTEAMRAMAEMADRTGRRIALEASAAEPEVMFQLLKLTDCPLVGVCYDPASQMIEGMDPLAGIERLADQVILARARDALAGSSARPGRETPIGQGQVDFAEYFAALEAAGYAQPAFLRRTESQHPLDELAEARAYLERYSD